MCLIKKSLSFDSDNNKEGELRSVNRNLLSRIKVDGEGRATEICLAAEGLD